MRDCQQGDKTGLAGTFRNHVGVMAYLPSLPGDAVLLDVFRAYPDTARPPLDYHQALLRGPSRSAWPNGN